MTAGLLDDAAAGPVSRAPVPQADPAHASVVQIIAYRADRAEPWYTGTGVFIEDHLLITAAHVVFNPADGAFGNVRQGGEGYAGSIEIRSEVLRIEPDVRRTDRFVATPGYTSQRDPAGDLAVIRLERPVGAARGVPPFAASRPQIVEAPLSVYGYPQYGARMFSSAGRCIHAERGLFFHTAEATEGQSGGAAMARIDGKSRLVGLHRASPAETPGNLPESWGAIWFTPEALRWIADMGARL